MTTNSPEPPSHTPGPWVLDSKVVLARGGTHAVAVVHGTDDHRENLANGRLIAAAPELLAALTRAVETMRELHGIGLTGSPRTAVAMWALYQQSPEMQAIHAAIAKAEGRTRLELAVLTEGTEI